MWESLPPRGGPRRLGLCRVLEQGCPSKDDDTNGWIDEWNAIVRSEQPSEFPHIAEIIE